MAFTIADIPDQSGKLAVITGATGGLGYETALALTGAGATVVLTGRSDSKGADALARIRALHPRADISYEPLDLASLKSVADFATRFAASHDRLDLLVNNGGVMALPQRKTTADGFEMQLGTNHLSHFALTAHLLPLLVKARSPRVVNVSSTAHYFGQIDFDDLQGEKSYKPWKAYGQSKIANLLFTFELQRLSDTSGWGLKSIAAHPGVASTELIPNGMGSSFFSRFIPFMGQPPAAGALPQLYAATAADAEPAGFYGPDGLFELKGAPAKARVAGKARDQSVARKLWLVSEQLTGLRFPVLASAA